MTELSHLAATYLVSLLIINVWGMTNAGILVGFLYKSRKVANSVQALYEMTLAKGLASASLTLIIAESIIFPQVANSTMPMWAQVLGGAAFYGASAGMAFASHRARSLLMTPKAIVENPQAG